MKIKHLFGLAVIAAMTASCSSNEDLGTPGTGTNEAGVGYATFTINLPSVSGSTTSGARGTRAGNPTYEQGTAKEYDVNDVTLLIFKKAGSSEGDYTFVEKADLGTMAPWKDENNSNGITASSTITAKLNNVNLTGTEYYALAILNNKTATDVKVKDPSTDQTYADWNVEGNAFPANFTDNSKGFYMANAPKFTSGEPTTLVKIDKVYATKQKAETNAATTIHVERGLAKVTVAALPTGKKPSGTKYQNDEVDITAWNLDVTNNSTFPIHKTAGLADKFTTIWGNVSGAAPVTARFVDASNTAFSRVYWGVDPNYNDDLNDETACKGAFTILEPNAEINGTADKPQYCLENTFDIKHMMQGQTTRVVFKATYTPNGLHKGDTFYKIGNSADLWKKADLETQIKTKAQEVLVAKDPTKDPTKVTLALKAADNNIEETAGTKILTEENVLYDGAKVSAEEIKAINEKLGLKDKTTTDPIVGIATYKSGESYYIARIKHFGDAATPWKEGDPTYGDNDDTNNKKYLGRYGVLRNNWYELTVGNVSGPGTPDIPTIKPTEPDDESYKYISVSVKILSWAKWSHTYDL